MAPKLIDPREALNADRASGHTPTPSAGEVVKQASRTAQALPPVAAKGTLEEAAKADFRVFLTLVWRYLLGVDPSPIQLDMAYWLQHGPDRAIIMAFRGFSKSWITGAYALWRLYRDPDEKILVVSGSLKRAIATTNWCLHLIMTMDILKDLRPKPSFRQSGQMFDVGNCIPAQSASFMAAGIGGQLVGFRGTCIIPDDVETQTNSLTVVMREKIEEAVKEFESVLTPGGVIKYLGTPHDLDSLYLKLLKLRDVHGRPVYSARIWPALFPSEEEIKGYGDMLAPYIPHQIRKHGPALVGHSTMPNRFTDDDLEKRRAAMGNNEFRLQFMLDLKGQFMDKYPLKLQNLIVTNLDDHRGPIHITWGNTHIHRDLPVMGFDGDFYYEPHDVSTDTAPWQKVVGWVDSSGQGEDETAMSIVALLHGRAYWVHLYASKDGYAEHVLLGIAKACIRFGVHELHIEANFGSGMFAQLLRPIMAREWDEHNKRLAAIGQKKRDGLTLTAIVDATASSKASKEKRILSILEPATQGHRLVAAKSVIEYDHRSMSNMEGEDSRHRYAFGYQYTHLTAEKDCLGHDDRVESLAGAVGLLAPDLGIDPGIAAKVAREEQLEDQLAKLLGLQADELGREGLAPPPNTGRMKAAERRTR